MIAGGLAGLGLVVVAALVVARTGRAPQQATATVTGGNPAVAPPVRQRREAALSYIRRNDLPGAAHIRRVLRSGPMLRLYTDLPESAVNSRTAVTLCRTAAAYLSGQHQRPEVFVHAREHDGYPVLANKMGVRDGCRLGTVP